MQALANTRVKPFRDRAGPYVDQFLFFLSVSWMGLFVINWMLPDKQFAVPGTAWCWSDLLVLSREATWVAFLAVWLVMGFTSHRALFCRHKPDGRRYYLFTNDADKQSYLRKWWLEAIICVTWVPFVVAPVQSAPVVEAMFLMGGVAHLARVSRFVQRKFDAHPLVTVCASIITLLAFGTVLLMLIEPDKYSNFHESARSLLRDGLTIGGDIKPDSEFGKDLNTLWVVVWVGVSAVFFALVREFVQYVCFRHGDPIRKISERLEVQEWEIKAQSGEIKNLRGQVTRLETMVAALLANAGVTIPASDDGKS